MGKSKQYKVTIGRTNTDGSSRTNTYSVTHGTLKTWVESWLNDQDAITLHIEQVEEEADA